MYQHTTVLKRNLYLDDIVIMLRKRESHPICFCDIWFNIERKDYYDNMYINRQYNMCRLFYYDCDYLQAKMEMNVQYDLFFHLTNCFNNFLALYKMSFSPICYYICQIHNGKKWWCDKYVFAAILVYSKSFYFSQIEKPMTRKIRFSPTWTTCKA